MRSIINSNVEIKYLDKSKSDLVQVSKDFIKDNKKIKFHKREKKKGGPYSKNDRHERRNEVHRLHFEYGYSARKIADMMKKSRHTINGDISFWFDKIVKNWKFADPIQWVIKHLERLEIQRTRLRVYLDKAISFQEKLALEKMIFDMDSKILQTQLKLVSSRDNIIRHAMVTLNNWYKKEKKDTRDLYDMDRYSVSEKTEQKINKLINEDRKRPI